MSRNIALIGQGFMGRAHMQAYHNLPLFFPKCEPPRLKVLCGVGEDLERKAAEYGFEEWEPDYRRVVCRPDVDVVDICTTDDTHKEIAVLAASAGKHVICEKPMSRTLDEASETAEAARKAGITHMVNFVYRAVPAVRLAKEIIDAGKIGEIYHFNCSYKQDFCLDPDVPFGWRMDAEKAGGGTMADKGSHMIDMARYLVGEFSEVSCRAKVYIHERRLPNSAEVRQVTSNDASVFAAEFANGAIGVFQASGIAAGEKNALTFELYGSKGSVKFNLEQLNELQVYFAGDDPQGFRSVMVTEKSHPYMSHWWPEGHVIGWQNLFVHQVYEFFTAIGTGRAAVPDFADGLRCQEVVDALIRSDREKRWVGVNRL